MLTSSCEWILRGGERRIHLISVFLLLLLLEELLSVQRHLKFDDSDDKRVFVYSALYSTQGNTTEKFLTCLNELKVLHFVIKLNNFP